MEKMMDPKIKQVITERTNHDILSSLLPYLYAPPPFLGELGEATRELRWSSYCWYLDPTIISRKKGKHEFWWGFGKWYDASCGLRYKDSAPVAIGASFADAITTGNSNPAFGGNALFWPHL